MRGAPNRSTRKVSRSKPLITPKRGRRGSAKSAGHHILGAYRQKHPEARLAPGRKAAFRRKSRGVAGFRQPSPGRGSRKREYEHAFLLFCIKHILTSGNLVFKDGPCWGLAYDVGGVTRGEEFTSLDACAEDLIAALQHQYGEGIEAGAA